MFDSFTTFNNTITTPTDNYHIHAGIVQQETQITTSAAIYSNFGLPTQHVDNSCHTGRQYTEEIHQVHLCCVMDFICMLLTTFLDLCDWIVQHNLYSPTRHISVKEQLIICLWVVSDSASNTVLQELFQHSREPMSL